MTNLTPYATGRANAAQFCQLWSSHVDSLERHLSAKTWAVTAAAVVLTVYPLARVVLLAALDAITPNVVRTVLRLIGV